MSELTLNILGVLTIYAVMGVLMFGLVKFAIWLATRKDNKK